MALQEETTIGMEMDVDKDGILTIKVDLKQDNGTTSSGKAKRVASTRGTRKYTHKSVGDFRVGLNVTKPL